MHLCRFCSAPTTQIVDFGQMPIANNFTVSSSRDSFRFQLVASFCESCFLFQLESQPEPSLMFHSDYPFFTGLSKKMADHFKQMLNVSIEQLGKSKKDIFVVEIGSNDGTMLSNLVDTGTRHLGIDPSYNVVQIAKQKGVTSIVEFFNTTSAGKIVDEFGKADLILAANVICHLPDLNDFAKAISILLENDGRFVFEEPYVGDVLSKTSYDQFYDEHVYLFSCTSVQKIFERYNLELIDAVHQDTHGGSMRYTIAPKGSGLISKSAEQLLNLESFNGFKDKKAYKDFGANCVTKRDELRNLLKNLKNQGSTIGGYAATSKSTTVLNYCDIGPETISFICDSTPQKQGKLTPGKYIPVISPEEMREKAPDFLVLFAWNHEQEVFEKERNYLRGRTRWIKFVPQVEIVDFDD